ncbi:MAG: hypothetical protein ACHQ7M_18105, partial [Chloroflexota bacterium]
CRDSGVSVTVCSHTSNFDRIPRRRASIGRMNEAGLRLTLNTDDPAMFGTDVGDAYVSIFRDLGWQPDMARRLCLTAVDACWLDDTDKRALRHAFQTEIDALMEEGLDSAGRRGRGDP